MEINTRYFEGSCSSSKQRVPDRARLASRGTLTKGCLRRDGGGSHRLAGPGREQLCRMVVPSNAAVTLARINCHREGCRWTRHRELAGVSEWYRHVPSGRAL